ncbi:MAG: 3-phosphoshikimate 1-carboxyvinyltransferase [Candidatus Cloacimonetes bacterium]|nr:3-phosphoshikimate 1-carboxyvinyltransferase [Candidatus Cloacimonadota bacterium]
METEVNLSGKVILEGSKAVENRVLIIATYLTMPLILRNGSSCDDIRTMLDNLQLLGLRLERDGKDLKLLPPDRLNANQKLSVQDSGTAWRFLLGRTALTKNLQTSISLSAQLAKRPWQGLAEILEKMGAEISEGDSAVSVKGTSWRGGWMKIDASISSQYISALLLNAVNLPQDLHLELQEPVVSRPYLDMTLQVMQEFGVTGRIDDDSIILEKNQFYRNRQYYEVEPDFSTACCFWALGALNRGEIYTSRWPGGKVLQPDYDFLKILARMGAVIEINDTGIMVQKKYLYGLETEMSDLPDQVPTLAVLALFARGRTAVHGIDHLRYKESDRITALVTELRKLGAHIVYDQGTLVIDPLREKPGKVKLLTYHDHRLVMAFSLIQRLLPEIQLEETASVAKSCPDFFRAWHSLK